MSCGVIGTFTKVEGRVEYRESESSPWKQAKVGDRVLNGYAVRCALRSSAEIELISGNVKAKASVAAGTAYTVPEEIVGDGTYRTDSTVKHGRADFTVDEVGFTNDLRVVPPSSSLAVRG